jgi:hypothetical protein
LQLLSSGFTIGGFRRSFGNPSLHFKRIGDLWSVRVGLHYRALALAEADGAHRFWIGTHAEYDRMLGG